MYHYAQPVANGSTEVNIAKPYCIGHYHKETSEKIKSILVHNEYLRLVLFGGYQGVQDESIGCRSYNSSHQDSDLEIELDTTWQ